LLLIVHQLRK